MTDSRFIVMIVDDDQSLRRAARRLGRATLRERFAAAAIVPAMAAVLSFRTSLPFRTVILKKWRAKPPLVAPVASLTIEWSQS